MTCDYGIFFSCFEMNVLEHLNNKQWREASTSLTPTLLNSLDEPSKHKIKTKISSLLKSNGSVRAVGCVLARQCFADWSIIKSHGSSWATIMLHILDLPDKVGHKPAVLTLYTLFMKIHGKTDLSREIGGSNVGEFMKRVLKHIDQLKEYDLVASMFQKYPTQCRPYINKFEPLLSSESASLARASLCCSEKSTTEVFNTKLRSEIESRNWDGICAYLQVAPIIRAKIPGSELVKLIGSEISSLKPVYVKKAYDFTLLNHEQLSQALLKHFDSLVFQISETLDMDTEICLKGIKLLDILLNLGGWITSNYVPLFSRVVRKVLKIGSSSGLVVGAVGLADFVQNPQNFVVQQLNAEDNVAVCELLVSVALNLPTIPQSLRVQVDKFVMEKGNDYQASKLTLYPGKYSILPLYLQKYDMKFVEGVVHPRFPPLQVSQGHLEYLQDSIEEPEVDTELLKEIKGADTDLPIAKSMTPESTTARNDQNPDQTANETIYQDVNETMSEVLPAIPAATRADRQDLGGPPEKRVKLDNESQMVIDKLPEEEDEEDDGLIIPTLTMDSD